jgi:uncharacterized protein (DUF433 family)
MPTGQPSEASRPKSGGISARAANRERISQRWQVARVSPLGQAVASGLMLPAPNTCLSNANPPCYAALDMNELERITINPNQCGGRPCVRGMRIRVKDVLDMLAGGATQEEILADFVLNLLPPEARP